MAKKIIFSEIEKQNIIDKHSNGMSPRKIAVFYNVGFKTILKLLKEKNVYINRSKDCFLKRYDVNEKYFDNIENEHQAYWLGFIAADGFVYKNRPMFSITSHQKDYSILEYFKNDLKTDYPIKIDKRDNCVKISINSKRIVNNLLKYNITPQKSFTIRFPNNLPKNLYNHYIRGYFDGDGSVYVSKCKQIEYSITSNENFLQDIQAILIKECNLNKTNFKKYKKTSAKTMVYYGNRQAKRIYDYLYKDATIFLARKKDKASQILKTSF